jgi:hypothetical protein
LLGLVAVLAGSGLVRLATAWRWGLLAVVLIGWLSALALAYRPAATSSNQAIRQTVELLAPARGCIVVAIDERLAEPMSADGGSRLNALGMALTLAGIPWQRERFNGLTMAELMRQTASQGVAILGPPAPREERAIRNRLQAIRLVAEPEGNFGVYVYRLPGLPICAPPERPPPLRSDQFGRNPAN